MFTVAHYFNKMKANDPLFASPDVEFRGSKALAQTCGDLGDFKRKKATKSEKTTLWKEDCIEQIDIGYPRLFFKLFPTIPD